MISLISVFWALVLIFAVIGLMRGWAKELMVTFSVFVAIMSIELVHTYFLPQPPTQKTDFLWRAAVVLALVFFGYETPAALSRVRGGGFTREKIQDALLGFVLGALNGYLIVGTLWYYLAQAGYPFDFIVDPQLIALKTAENNCDTAFSQALAAEIERFLVYMPPIFLKPPLIYFAVALSFIFVIVVFV